MQLEMQLRKAIFSCKVSLSVCRFEAISFFAIYSKNLQATHTWKCATLPNIFLRMPQEKK